MRRVQRKSFENTNTGVFGSAESSASQEDSEDMTTGFYSWLRESRKDDVALAKCIGNVVEKLEATSTSGDRPGILLGKIQSGKTRAFVGVIACAFDRGYDVAVVFTKGTRTLSMQTVTRLAYDFQKFIDDDQLLVLDIMKPPGRLTRGEQGRKLVIVAKKQIKNLERILDFFDKQYPLLKGKRVLIVDDEADLASVRFVRPRNRPDDLEQGRIAEKIDEMRRLVTAVGYLQVTATPYSLYLQPESYGPESDDTFVFKPKRPAFTELLPIHSGYVGGDDYFLAPSNDDPRSFLFVEVPQEEQDRLRRSDARSIKPTGILSTPGISRLVRAIVTFILAVSLRRWQQAEREEKEQKYAMIIHNDTQKAAHAWQHQVIEWIFQALEEMASSDVEKLRPLFDGAYTDLNNSITADHGAVPTRPKAFEMFVEGARSGRVAIESVNSDQDVLALLDPRSGELKLREPFNVYVGGNILDRGITIPNLISFYYGRNPRTMQADTVLQHSRMYGNRDRRDLAVTRFYTTRLVYDRLFTINQFENTLRWAFESGTHEKGVVFIQADRRRGVRPCAPNKLLLSRTVAVNPTGLYLPTGFETSKIKDLIAAERELQRVIPNDAINKKTFVEIDRGTALHIISVIEKVLVFPDGDEFEWDAMRGLLDYYTDARGGGDGRVLLLAETGRKLDRSNSGDKSGLSILGGGPIRNLVVDPRRSKPALVLLQQEGTKALHWSGHSFWWPIFSAPGTVEPCIFATKVATD
jgi:hypothetical protein